MHTKILNIAFEDLLNNHSQHSDEQMMKMIGKAFFLKFVKMVEKQIQTMMQDLLLLCKALKRTIHLIKKITEQSVKFDYFSFFFMAA